MKLIFCLALVCLGLIYAGSSVPLQEDDISERIGFLIGSLSKLTEELHNLTSQNGYEIMQGKFAPCNDEKVISFNLTYTYTMHVPIKIFLLIF